MRCLIPFVLLSLPLAAVPATSQDTQPQDTRPQSTAEPVRMSAAVFGAQAEVEVRDLPRAAAEEAIRAALAEIYTIDRLTTEGSGLAGSIGDLNAATGPLRGLDPRLATLLLDSLRYCLWSSGSHGPLGGAVYELWAETEGGTPHPLDLRQAVASAECGRLAVNGNGERPAELTFERGEESRVLLLQAARGFAIDRAVEMLAEHGASNAWVEIGPVVRATGPGPDGYGWLLSLPPAPGEKSPLDEVWLRDKAAAVVDNRPIYRGSVPLIDQRTGVPARGVLMVAVAAAQAFDAEVLAASLYTIGMRDGLRRLGALAPRPAVYWLLGRDDVGQPLESTYRWSDLPRLKRRR